jgi:hypothetical protein
MDPETLTVHFLNVAWYPLSVDPTAFPSTEGGLHK